MNEIFFGFSGYEKLNNLLNMVRNYRHGKNFVKSDSEKK